MQMACRAELQNPQSVITFRMGRSERSTNPSWRNALSRRERGLSAEEFVRTFCERHAVINYDRTVTLYGEPATFKRLRGELTLANSSTGLEYSSEVISAALDKYLDEKDRLFVQNYSRRLCCVGQPDDAPLRDWLRAVTGTIDELDLAVMKHFLWQVKRKLDGQPVEYHIMPVIVGRTGSGKSVAVEKLVGPVKPLVESGRDCSIFEDSREWTMFHRMYVVVLDELSRADQTDVNAMKRVITADTLSYRALYTQDHVPGRMVSTFIGTSNNFISEVVLDSTSARRFWQIQSQSLIDWDTINKIDYTALWRSVDVADSRSPVRDAWQAIQARQHAEFRHKSAVEEWLAERYEIVGESEPGIKAGDAYQNFRAWADLNNQGRLLSSTKFGLELKRVDGVVKTKRADSNWYNIRPKDIGDTLAKVRT
jgi:hypothetical protein